MTDITYSCRPATDEETNATIEELKAHTEAAIGIKVQFEPFALLAHEGNTMVGSIIGKIYSNWMHLDLVWVAEQHRGKGIGRRLMQQAVDTATARGLTGIEVWSQSWQAPEFYQHMGFSNFVVMDDFLPGRKRHILRHTLGKGTS